MKRTAIICLAACTMMAALACKANADMFTYDFAGAIGDYQHQDVRSFDFDFGRTFSSIESISINWSGEVFQGYYQIPYSGYTYPLDGAFSANIGVDSVTQSNFSGTFSDVYTIDSPFQFGLFDGKSKLDVNFQSQTGEYMQIYATGRIDSLSLVLNATEGTPSYSDFYDWHEYNGHKYALTLEPKSNWADAQAEANRAGGALVSINDQAENDWLAETFGLLASDLLYTGGRDLGYVEPSGSGIVGDLILHSDWQWANGEPISYRNNDIEEWSYAFITYTTPLLTFEPYSGSWMAVGDGGDYPLLGIIEAAPVPEPSSLLALTAGMGILFGAIRRRR